MNPKTNPSLEEIASAAEAAELRTPPTVVEALMGGDAPKISGIRLNPMNAGAWLIFEKISHPVVLGTAVGATMTIHDVISALFVLSRPTVDTMRLVRENEFADAVLAFAEKIPLTSAADAEEIIRHVESAFGAALPMRSPHESGQKKTEASADS